MAAASRSVPANWNRVFLAAASEPADSSIRSAEIAEATMRICCVRWLPSHATMMRLAVTDPTIAPSVLAA
jgi:hypothetical protein